jgi:methyl-accepting chemotaxis protein
VNVEKTREYTVYRLKQLSALPSEIKLLTQSKRNSDSLIFTEIRSMKLVLEAYHVPHYLQPSSIQKYELPQFEKNLSANDKLILAETIMFDEQYYIDKEKIMGPITTFNSQLQERINLDILEAQQQLNSLKIQLNTTLFILALLICIIIWLRVLYIKSPAKS